MAMLTLIVCAVITTAASVEPDTRYTNLQVLPKNIKPAELNKIMLDDFEDGLGVGCNFCHAPDKSDSTKLDYASDAKPEKKIARLMMHMTLGINKQYFQVKSPALGNPLMAVTCSTCHNGQPRPAMSSE